ncbi:hypothetical protein C8R45DRAFT_1080381 [Mycena sanguinolenta]|nr:hypothetical protein C8R45DRAFT_1080381 [Mycena sanguinolenta]
MFSPPHALERVPPRAVFVLLLAQPARLALLEPLREPVPVLVACALAQQNRERACAQQRESERAARMRYLPNRGGYAYDHPSDDDDDDNYYAGNNNYGYLNPRQCTLLEAKRRQALEQQQLRRRCRAQLQEEAMRQKAVSPPLASLSVEHGADSAAQAQAHPTAQRHNSPLRRSPSPSSTQTPTARSPSPAAAPIQTPSSSKAEPTPEQLESAATTLQSAFRAHRAHRAISTLSTQFDALRAGFEVPRMIDYQTGEGVVSFLARLLVSLDAVESRGNTAIRARRRGVVRRIEVEASRLECFWRGVWAAHVRRLKQEEGGEKVEGEKEEEEMREGEEQVHAMVVDADALPFFDALMSSEEEEEDEGEEEFEFHTPPASPLPVVAAADFGEKVGVEEMDEDEFVLV